MVCFAGAGCPVIGRTPAGTIFAADNGRRKGQVPPSGGFLPARSLQSRRQSSLLRSRVTCYDLSTKTLATVTKPGAPRFVLRVTEAVESFPVT